MPARGTAQARTDAALATVTGDGALEAVAVMRAAGISGPQACPKAQRHGPAVAAVTIGVLLPTTTAVLGHADIATTAICTAAVGLLGTRIVKRMW